MPEVSVAPARRGARRAIALASAAALVAGLAACTSDGTDRADSSGSGATSADGNGAAPSVAGPTGPAGSGTPTSIAPAPTTTGRTPSGGGINQTVPARTLETKAPVPLSARASFGGNITAAITDITAIKATGRGPGEVTGPALRVTFRVTNRSGSALSLAAVTADLTDSAGAPSVSMSGPPAAPFTGSVASGSSRSAVYVFAVAANRRAPVVISLNYSANAPVVLFKGNAS